MENVEHALSDQPHVSFEAAPAVPWESLIILQRHSKYDASHPTDFDNPTEEEKALFGHLTAEGRELARTEAEQRTKEILKAAGDQVDFLVITSPTFWLDQSELGQRAVETGEIISQVIREELDAAGADPARLLNLSPSIKGEQTREHSNAEDARFFDQGRQFTKFMRETYGGQGREFWQNFIADTHKDVREADGAEGPQELADRIQKLIDAIARFSSYYEHHHPGRKLATFIVSHSGSLETYAHWKLGIPVESYAADYNDAIPIAIQPDGRAVAKVNNQEYEAPLRAR